MAGSAGMSAPTAMTATRFGVVVALTVLILDQITKMWILFVFDLPERGRVAILPFIDFVMVWNRGISYGLLQQEGLFGWLVLLAVTIAAVVFLGIWLRRERSRLSAFAIGLILGGAIGNAIDRVAYGAVADFVLFHVGSFQWYVFNIADAAIVVGVVLLLYGALGRDERSSVGHDGIKG
jgi:signal peptidase II